LLRRIIHVPVGGDADVPVFRDEAVPRPKLANAGEERLLGQRVLHAGDLKDCFFIPARRHPQREERLGFRGDRQPKPGLVEAKRLDAEAVPRRQQAATMAVPEDERELATEMIEKGDPVLLIEVNGDLAVAARAKAMAELAQLCAQAVVVVELAVDRDDDL